MLDRRNGARPSQAVEARMEVGVQSQDDPLSSAELCSLFSRLPNVAELEDVAQALIAYYRVNAFRLGADVVGSFLLPFYMGEAAAPGAISSLLHVILTADETDDLEPLLFEQGFHELILGQIPSGRTLLVLRGLCFRSPRVREWIVSPEVDIVAKVAPLLRGADDETELRDAHWLFRHIPLVQSTRGPIQAVVIRLADAMLAPDVHPVVLEELLWTFAAWGTRIAEVSAALFRHPAFGDFVARMAADAASVSRLLYLLDLCFGNREHVDDNRLQPLKLSGLLEPQLKQIPIDFLVATIRGDDGEPLSISDAGRTLSRVIEDSDEVAYCMELGVVPRLFYLLEELDDYFGKLQVFRMLCRMVELATLEQAEVLMEAGFPDALTANMEGMMRDVPNELCSALDSLCRLGEVENRREWLELVFAEDVVKNLSVMADWTFKQHNDDMMMVSQAAQAILCRADDDFTQYISV
jgi:hypothetical protein